MSSTFGVTEIHRVLGRDLIEAARRVGCTSLTAASPPRLPEGVKEVPPYRCIYCGAPSWYEPVDQSPPADYCHESDHGGPDDDA